MSVRTWIASNVRVYHDNPTTKRDFRAQLRGNKALALWSVYLVLLIAFSMLAYNAIAGARFLSVTDIQFRLQGYYQSTFGMLAAALCLITPALTAGAIVVERQRRSLDLLFSAPVSLKGLLVGKMLSSYRYTWMLLILSVPVASVAVVMGGATWNDVLQGYAILSFCGLVLTSIGLLISAVSDSVGAAIIWTYLSVGLYLTLVYFVGEAQVRPFPMGRDSPSWYVGLSPFLAYLAAPGHVDLGFVSLPNWIVLAIVSLAICRLLILGAASHLSPFGGKETKSFRIQLPIYLFLIFVGSRVAMPGGSYTPPVDALFIMIATSILIPFMTYLVSYGPDGGNKYRRGGFANWSQILTGGRAGSFPYLALLWVAIVAGVSAGMLIQPNPAGVSGPFITLTSARVIYTYPLASHWVAIAQASAWSVGFLFMWFGIGRLVSSRSRTLKASRIGLIAMIILLLGIPIPILSIINAQTNPYGGLSRVWMAFAYYPFMDQSWLSFAPGYALVMAAIGWVAFSLERRQSNRAILEMPQ